MRHRITSFRLLKHRALHEHALYVNHRNRIYKSCIASRFGRVSCASEIAGSTASLALEILHITLVLSRRGAHVEYAGIAALAGVRIGLARIEPIFAGLSVRITAFLLAAKNTQG